MVDRAFISRFSPNRTDPEILESIFVQREPLAELWLGRLRDSILSGTKHHLLAIGPRGCGKSHLVSLLVHRLKKDPAILESVRVARLPEDETTTSFWKFLLRILRALSTEYDDEFPPPPRDLIEDETDERRATVLTNYLLTALKGHTLLVVVENMDDVLRGLKEEGQKRWRAFLQETAATATLATAQQLTEDVCDRKRPFFNFFEIEHLTPLSVDDALSLLQKLADENDNDDLAAFLQTATGRARVRAIRHVTGGSHRVFIILSEFATREKLDNLVVAFEELLDDLTPYYQERLRWLPDQQREIVEFLCRQHRTIPVKDIASDLFLSEQTAAAQLKALRDKGYVTSQSVGRESRYELAEPLMRLCVEVKNPAHEPIRLVVEFLQIWYDQAGVAARLECLPTGADIERRYYHAALETLRTSSPRIIDTVLDRDLAAARLSGQTEVVRVLDEIIATTDSAERCFEVAVELIQLRQQEATLAASERAIDLDPGNPLLWSMKALALTSLGRYDNALSLSERALAISPDKSWAWISQGVTLVGLNRHEDALVAIERATTLEPRFPQLWEMIGSLQFTLGRNEEALSSMDRAIALAPKSTMYLNVKAEQLNKLNRPEEALAHSEKAVAIDAKDSTSYLNRGIAKLGLREITSSISDFRRAISLNADLDKAHERLTEALVLEGNWEEAERHTLARFQLPGALNSQTFNLIAAIFRTCDQETWKHRVERLVSLAREARDEMGGHIPERGHRESLLASTDSTTPPNPLLVLGSSLILSLAEDVYAETSPESLGAWADLWLDKGKSYPELTVPLRLFRTGIRYLQTKDKRSLVDLVQEERSVLQFVFGLDTSDTVS